MPKDLIIDQTSQFPALIVYRAQVAELEIRVGNPGHDPPKVLLRNVDFGCAAYNVCCGVGPLY